MEEQENINLEQATEADIRACFRLLLGREIGETELGWHNWRVGMPVKDLVRNYLNSKECTDRGLLARDASRTTELIETYGFKIHIDPTELDVGPAVKGGVYEPNVVAAFQSILKPGMRVVDIGANIGFMTMLAASIVGPSGRVMAVEPNPANGRLLMASRLANKFDHIDLLMSAAGETILPLALYVESSNGRVGNPGNSDQAVLDATTLVPVVKLDPIVAGWGSVDFVKIDIEGAEHLALKGAENMLRTHRPIILSEFSPHSIRTVSQTSGQEYLQFLLDLGYSIGKLEDDGTANLVDEYGPVISAFENQSSDHIDILAIQKI